MSKKEKPRLNRAPTVENRKARHDYTILEQVEAGLVLEGSEVKSIRGGGLSLAESYIRVVQGEVWLMGAHIQPYENIGYGAPDPLRVRKLLLHRKEIQRLSSKVQEKGLTLVPLRLYFNKRGKIKLMIGLAQGKSKSDKRHDLKAKAQKRDVERQGSLRIKL